MSREKKTILILGGGVMQLPAIRIAKERHWRVVVADGDRDAVGAELADIFLHVDLKDREAMTEAAATFRRRGELDGVFTAGTDFSTTVAWVADQLGLPGISFETALRATDKSLMREAFREAGVPSPAFLMLRSTVEAEEAISRLGLPLVVKPVDNMGSRGIRRIDRAAELIPAVEVALRYSRSGKVIVEEFIPGPEYSIDAIVEQGRVTVCGVADRNILYPPYFVEMGHTMPTQSDDSVVESLVSVFEAGIRALGIGDGAAKGDMKLSPKGPVVGEIAARLSGGYMSGWTYPYASGVQTTEAALDLAVGRPARELVPKWNKVAAERAFVSIPGLVSHVTGFEAACRLPSVKNGFLRVRSGDRVQFPTNNVEKCGNFISQADTHAEAIWAAEEACRSVVVVLAPGDPETGAFLFSHRHPWVPSAFRLDDPELEERLERLPDFIDSSDGGGGHLSIMPLPGIERVKSLDWQGRSLVRAVELIQTETGITMNVGGDIVLGRTFWDAVLRGGVQGGIWVVETVREALGGRSHVRQLVTAWSD